MKKLITMFIVLVMTVSMLAACGTPGSETSTGSTVNAENYAYDKTWPAETLKIGVEIFNPTDDTWLRVKDYYDYLASIFNIEFIYSEAISSPEQEFAFINSMAAAGAKGIYAYYNASGPSAIMEATRLGMYYVGIIDYYDRFLDNEFYVGGYTFTGADGKNGDYTAGYELGYNLANQGVKHIVYGSGETKVAMFKERAEGFYAGVAAAQAEGSTARFDKEKDVIGGWPDLPGFAPLQTAAISADYDAVGSATDIAYWFQPVKAANKQMKMACIGSVGESYKPYFESGVISTIVYDAPEFVHGAPMIMLINCATGYSNLSKNEDGTPRLQHVYRWTVNSNELFLEIYNKHASGEFYVSKEDTAKLFGGLNANASLDMMNQVYDITMAQALGK